MSKTTTRPFTRLGDMDQLIEALEIVADLALQNMIENNEPDLGDERQRQDDAYAIVLQHIKNLHEV